MPPKVTDTRTPAESLHAVEAETAAAARKVVASYAHDFFDGVTLMCMLGIETEGLNYQKVAADHEAALAPKKVTKKAKATKKASKKTTTKKTTKKTTAKKTAAKKTTAKKATKKATKKTTKATQA
ncbi:MULTISPECIES: hypothetical protein [unclassified Corynebacterium]|uniref:hypothetical protein n=1 Tax=unclassified Corynebacterium TaxID=2624378 RepID=UPI0021696E37|nr:MULTISPECIES: hypothetical protein [unclassified Corynebacterium]MCS4490281.1 hypothetical protein [Corynebacterium sp. ES2775-CONJ]MCS4491908.1 hypothetical protein [Corynebacterium sp. ES2715-CONJ3]MCS4532013.1 hypothetical protein [Corynebacterium sp. ES2730-CONJ]